MLIDKNTQPNGIRSCQMGKKKAASPGGLPDFAYPKTQALAGVHARTCGPAHAEGKHALSLASYDRRNRAC
ncbi:MAG TPA: hypothetical protein VGN31_03260, partial [Paraburkholderia sp.]